MGGSIEIRQYNLFKIKSFNSIISVVFVILNTIFTLNASKLIIKPNVPLKAYKDLTAFKLYLLDVGLLCKLSGLYPQAYITGHILFTEFKGALVENYIAQCLQMHHTTDLFYWTSKRSAEVDFLIQYQNNILPIEVKSDLNVRSKSLAYYKKEYQPKLRVCFSAKNLTLDDDLLNIPLFMADQLKKLLGSALTAC